jgi:hypothetical protein
VRRICFSWLALIIATFAPPAAAETSGPVFLTSADARKAIVDESAEPYFNRLQPMEMAAKTGQPVSGNTLAEQRAETRRRYRQGVLSFSAAEKRALRWYVSSLQSELEDAYPGLAQSPWRFIKVKDHIEGGLPHTRGSHIILSEGLLSRMVGSMERAPEPAALFETGSVLVHELVHVHQRRQPRRYAEFYRTEWGFVKAERIKGNRWMRKHQVVNPDGTDLSWIFPIRNGKRVRWILPLVVFSEGAGPKRMPQDFRQIAIALQGANGHYRVAEARDGRPLMKPIREEAAYAHRFNGAFSLFHPNEIAADLLSRIFAFDHLLPREQNSEGTRMAAEQLFGAARKQFKRLYR